MLLKTQFDYSNNLYFYLQCVQLQNPNWLPQIPTGYHRIPTGYHRSQLVTTESQLVTTDPNWLPQIPTGYHRSQLVTTDPNWLPQNPNWLPQIPTGYHRSQLVTTDPNWLPQNPNWLPQIPTGYHRIQIGYTASVFYRKLILSRVFTWTHKQLYEQYLQSRNSKKNGSLSLSCIIGWRKEMFYLTTHSTHFIYGYMASYIW